MAHRPAAEEVPDCNRCQHFHITYDPQFPYGCRALKFKSRRKPQQDVIEASLQPCMAFTPKVRSRS